MTASSCVDRCVPIASEVTGTRWLVELHTATASAATAVHFDDRGGGGIVNGAGSYGWGGADGTQFVVDRSKRTFTLYMVQTQHYKAPTYPAFLALANEAAGGAPAGAGMAGGGAPGPSGVMGGAIKKYDKNGDGKLDRSELPAALFDRLDTDKDGFVTEEELKALWKAR